MLSKPVYPLGLTGKNFSVEVKGAHYHRRSLEGMFQIERGRDNKEFYVDVTLVPEPDNPFSTSGNAISVRWWDNVVGYISSDECAKYSQLRRVAASGYDAGATMRVWTNVGWKGERDFWLSLALPDPDLLLPLNDPPTDGFVLLPEGPKTQVAKESEHTEYLADFVPLSGLGQVLVSLHLFEAGKTKKWEAVEIRLDGERVGELSKVSSEKFAPIVRHFDSQGLTVISRATISGSSIAAEIVLVAARAHELAEELLETDVTKPLPRLVHYQADPREYDAVPRYQPEDDEAPFSTRQHGDEAEEVTLPEVESVVKTTHPDAYNGDSLDQEVRTEDDDSDLAFESNASDVRRPSSANSPITESHVFGEQPPIASYAASHNHDPYSQRLSAPGASRPVNKTIAWLWWALLGLLGGHRYYLGNIGMGLLQTLTVGGFGIWWIADAFFINKRIRDINLHQAPRIKF
ncbi:NINE protein [Corynebacterium sp. Q4381]|uniref:NINE protein n=1 Tax=Corynebacterium sp. Marseille-Q4381 TaxID=3121597 RepID=UPI002FE50A94